MGKERTHNETKTILDTLTLLNQ